MSKKTIAKLLCNECKENTDCEFQFCKVMKFGTKKWQTIGFATQQNIQVFESEKTGNVVSAKYIDGEYLTKDEIERELF